MKPRVLRTPLHYAAADAKPEVLAQLIAEGGNVNAQDSSGWAPLHFAAQALSTECVSLLLAAGAQVDIQDSFGNTPLARAVFGYLGDGSLIQLLRAAGADPHLKNKHGISPVELACSITNRDVAKFFADTAA